MINKFLIVLIFRFIQILLWNNITGCPKHLETFQNYFMILSYTLYTRIYCKKTILLFMVILDWHGSFQLFLHPFHYFVPIFTFYVINSVKAYLYLINNMLLHYESSIHNFFIVKTNNKKYSEYLYCVVQLRYNHYFFYYSLVLFYIIKLCLPNQ